MKIIHNKNNLLTINEDKCQNTQKDIKLTIKPNNIELAEVNDVDFFFANIQNNLKWTQHITKLTNRSQTNEIKKLILENIKQIIYNSVFALKTAISKIQNITAQYKISSYY